MSAPDTALSGNPLPPSSDVKRSRFAKERAGTWLFAASFSLGIWGLGLKLLSPSHPMPPTFAILKFAALAPGGSADGRAVVIWTGEETISAVGYPVIGGAPVIELAPVHR